MLPGLVNAHDHLDLSTCPPLGRPPYPNAYAWGEDVAAHDGAAAAAAMAVPLVDRLFLGGLRNLLCGATGVLHHSGFHRSLGRDDFPVRVQHRYDFAQSPGLTPQLRKAYRTTDRRIPFLVHAAEGTDEVASAEIARLAEANVLRQNTVVIHAIACSDEDRARLATARACVVWCPEAALRL
ncbi:MAG: amidohydrolase, partial [Vicinamibacteria bacterium]|nr:amidohydrolase [Vicinamibacteria bacterium]